MSNEELVFVRKPTPGQKALLESQPTWDHDVETWPAYYDNRSETFLVIEGKGYITTEDGKEYHFEKGDLVTCKTDFNCTWTVTEHIYKHYIFDADLNV